MTLLTNENYPLDQLICTSHMSPLGGLITEIDCHSQVDLGIHLLGDCLGLMDAK